MNPTKTIKSVSRLIFYIISKKDFSGTNCKLTKCCKAIQLSMSIRIHHISKTGASDLDYVMANSQYTHIFINIFILPQILLWNYIGQNTCPDQRWIHALIRLDLIHISNQWFHRALTTFSLLIFGAKCTTMSKECFCIELKELNTGLFFYLKWIIMGLASCYANIISLQYFRSVMEKLVKMCVYCEFSITDKLNPKPLHFRYN